MVHEEEEEEGVWCEPQRVRSGVESVATAWCSRHQLASHTVMVVTVLLLNLLFTSTVPVHQRAAGPSPSGMESMADSATGTPRLCPPRSWWRR